MDITLSEALTDYYNVRLSRVSDSTRKANEQQLERWRRWVAREVQENVYLSNIDDRLMVRYFNRLRPPAYQPASFNAYRQYLNAFWMFCRGEGWISVNPMRHVDPLRQNRRVRLRLSPDELMEALNNATDPRDRVALAVGMNTALRAGDAMALTVGAVNLGDDTLTAWIEKTDTEEVLPITAELRVELIRWMRVYAEKMGLDDWRDLPNNWTLIPPAQGQAAVGGGRRVVYRPDRRYRHPERIVQTALAGLGHPTKGEGFHTLRRSAARALHDMAAADPDFAGAPIRVAQALLGHKHQSTTEGYLGITLEKQQRDAMMQGKSFLTRASLMNEKRREEVTGEDGNRAAM